VDTREKNHVGCHSAKRRHLTQEETESGDHPHVLEKKPLNFAHEKQMKDHFQKRKNTGGEKDSWRGATPGAVAMPKSSENCIQYQKIDRTKKKRGKGEKKRQDF